MLFQEVVFYLKKVSVIDPFDSTPKNRYVVSSFYFVTYLGVETSRDVTGNIKKKLISHCIFWIPIKNSTDYVFFKDSCELYFLQRYLHVFY